MKTVGLLAILLVCLLLTACGVPTGQTGPVAATTAPVAQFASAIAEGTEITVCGVITDSVSCLHDYSLSVRQMEKIKNSELLLLSGAGLEDFMADVLMEQDCLADCSDGAAMLEKAHGDHTHADPHLWLDPDRACVMAENICLALSQAYPAHKHIFEANTQMLLQRLKELKAWGAEELEDCTHRQMITFHDGFAYLADAFDLHILATMEAEAGSTPSAADLTKIVKLVEEHGLGSVFSEVGGTNAAARIVCAETGAQEYCLDMAMGGNDYFSAMEYNIKTLKEALK